MKPTVTELINMLDKPNLLKWANDIGLKGISLQDYRKKSTTAGISLHKQIENYILYKTNFENIEHQKKFIQFAENKEFINTETNIETDYFIGRYDAKIKINNNIFICDYKSSSGIYFETKLQLAAYKMANTECKLAVIEIPNFEFKPVEIDFKKYELILKCLHKIWQLKKEI